MEVYFHVSNPVHLDAKTCNINKLILNFCPSQKLIHNDGKIKNLIAVYI